LTAAALRFRKPPTPSTPNYDALIATHALANGVPEVLVHRVIVRESLTTRRWSARRHHRSDADQVATARGSATPAMPPDCRSQHQTSPTR